MNSLYKNHTSDISKSLNFIQSPMSSKLENKNKVFTN